MINCDICGVQLLQSGNAGIYTCKEISVWIEDRQRYLEIRHITCHVVDNKISYKLINIFPYQFQLFYDINKTIISKMIIRSSVGDDGKNVVYATDKKNLLEIDHILELPWSDQDQVIQKLKLYSIFS